MAGNSFGTLFKVTTFGESHGEQIGVVIDGCPAGLEMDLTFVQRSLDRRRPGQSHLTTQRQEGDQVHFVSGIFEGKTTGTPICGLIQNKDIQSKDYDHLKDVYRPSHADYTYQAKYGHRDHRGGGRASARETACRVVAGAIAQLFLRQIGVRIVACVSQVGDLKFEQPLESLTEQNWKACELSPVRCPDPVMAKKMTQLIQAVRADGDTIGGTISGLITGCPVGLGEPVFDRLNADLAKAMFSVNAVKGFELGSGFAGVALRGSQHNDTFFTDQSREGAHALPHGHGQKTAKSATQSAIQDGTQDAMNKSQVTGTIKTSSNHSGGIQGGISNGMGIDFKVAFKPVATLMQTQLTVTKTGEQTRVEGQGRHDPCVLPRAVVIVEAMAALVLADHVLRHRASQV